MTIHTTHTSSTRLAQIKTDTSFILIFPKSEVLSNFFYITHYDQLFTAFKTIASGSKSTIKLGTRCSDEFCQIYCIGSLMCQLTVLVVQCYFVPSLGRRGNIGQGRFVPGTLSPRNASSKGRIV